ncbi:hypothetical protein [Ferruginibacter sp.]|nr:hypothetical protein [Ferruginibacter sp.]
MKKLNNYFVAIICLLLLSMQAIAQKEIFDIATYKPPKDFKKDAKFGVINYTNVNTNNGGFCVITMFASTVSTGDAEKDFEREWKDLVVTPYKAEASPKTEKQNTAEGWNVVSASAPIKLNGADIYVLLTVVSGFGKTMSIRTSLNDEAYITKIHAMFSSMDLDKTKTAALGNTTTINNTIQAKATGGTGKFGLMNYIAPAGWSEQKFSDGVVFKPLDLPADEHLAIQIMQPLNSSGTLEQVLAQSFEEATKMYNGSSMYQADGKYSKNTVQRSFNGWEYIRGKGGIQVNNSIETGLELFVIKINSRFERVAILESRKYCGGVSRYYATDRIIYRNDIESLLFSLQFTSFNATVLAPGTINGNAVVGVWEGTIQSTGAATGVRLDVFVPIFFTNGQVYFGPKFPTEGLNGLDSRIPPELFPRNWGTYSFSNGRGVLKMPFAEIPFRTDGAKLIVTKNQMDWPFYKKNTVDGARFNGTYSMSESYGIHPIITFTADGKFNDNGAIRILNHEGNTCINPGFKPGSGTYDVKDYTITFNYTDGRKIKIAYLGTGYEKNNLSPATLRMSFNDDPMNRQ